MSQTASSLSFPSAVTMARADLKTSLTNAMTERTIKRQ